MKFFYILTFFAFIIFFNSCTENNTTNVIGYERTLVIVSDFTLESETILSITGAVKKEHPEVDVQLIKNKNFDIHEAAYWLELSAGLYPENTCFAVIVEPGEAVKKIVFNSGSRMVIAPDNGTSTRFRKKYTHSEIHYIDNPAIFGGNYTNVEEIPTEVFFTEAVLKMLDNAPVSSFGSLCTNPVEITIEEAARSGDVINGQIVLTDNFGNCESNISKNLLTGFELGDILQIQTSTHNFYAKFGTDYSSVAENENTAFINSRGKLEFAVNFGNMSERYSLNAGEIISVKKVKIIAGILRYNSSTLVDNIISDMKTELAAHGFNDDTKITFIEKNAEGDITKFPQLINELIAAGVNIVIPVSTPASQNALQYIPDNIPVVYTYVTSPEFAGLINKRLNATGLSDATNFDDYLKFVKELMPDLKKAGRIYNPSESNSAFSQDRFISLGSFYGLTYDNEEINSADDITTAFNNLKSRNITAILTAADNTVNLGMGTLASMAKLNNIIVIGDSEENTIDGALASISVDYGVLAKATGVTVGNVILGVNPDNIQIQRFPTSVITLNKTTANSIGFTFTQSMLNKAAKVIE